MKHDGVSLKKNLASPCGFFYLLRSWQLFIIYKLKIIPFPDDCWQTRVGGDEFLKNFHPSLLFVEEVTKMPLFLSYEVLRSGSFQIDFWVLNPLIMAIASYQILNQWFKAGFKLQIADSCRSRLSDCGAVVILSPEIIPFCLAFGLGWGWNWS